ncbi:hypothetical protein BGW37DRAFT_485368 [Umbelopsis sp. PMI_123]|nr:hypothetical protein BGW37DRAFT_485368 [Umbelopsis sp. PMI_123]
MYFRLILYITMISWTFLFSQRQFTHKFNCVYWSLSHRFSRRRERVRVRVCGVTRRHKLSQFFFDHLSSAFTQTRSPSNHKSKASTYAYLLYFANIRNTSGSRWQPLTLNTIFFFSSGQRITHKITARC